MARLLSWNDGAVLAEKARLMRAIARAFDADQEALDQWSATEGEPEESQKKRMAMRTHSELAESVLDLYRYLDSTDRPTRFYVDKNEGFFCVKPSGQVGRESWLDIGSTAANLDVSIESRFVFSKEELDRAFAADGRIDPTLFLYDAAHAEDVCDVTVSRLGEESVLFNE